MNILATTAFVLASITGATQVTTNATINPLCSEAGMAPHAEAMSSPTNTTAPVDRAFSATAPTPSQWGSASYGSWVQVADGSDNWYRIKTSSNNGVDYQMQVHYTDASGRKRTQTFGGLQNWTDTTLRGIGKGPVSVRFKVSTLNNKRGASISGTVH